MNFAEGVQKISGPKEPSTFIYPVLSKNPIPKIEKIQGNFENFFSREKHEEIKDLLRSKPENFRELFLANPNTRGLIFDLKV